MQELFYGHAHLPGIVQRQPVGCSAPTRVGVGLTWGPVCTVHSLRVCTSAKRSWSEILSSTLTSIPSPFKLKNPPSLLKKLCLVQEVASTVADACWFFYLCPRGILTGVIAVFVLHTSIFNMITTIYDTQPSSISLSTTVHHAIVCSVAVVIIGSHSICFCPTQSISRSPGGTVPQGWDPYMVFGSVLNIIYLANEVLWLATTVSQTLVKARRWLSDGVAQAV